MVGKEDDGTLAGRIREALRESKSPADDPAIVGKIHGLVARQLYQDLATGFQELQDACSEEDYSRADKSFVPKTADQRINYLHFFARATGISVPENILLPFLEDRLRASDSKNLSKLLSLTDDSVIQDPSTLDKLGRMILKFEVHDRAEEADCLRERYPAATYSPAAAEEAYFELFDLAGIQYIISRKPVGPRIDRLFKLTKQPFSPANLAVFLQEYLITELQDEWVGGLKNVFVGTGCHFSPNLSVLQKYDELLRKPSYFAFAVLARMGEATPEQTRGAEVMERLRALTGFDQEEESVKELQRVTLRDKCIWVFDWIYSHTTYRLPAPEIAKYGLEQADKIVERRNRGEAWS